MEQEDLKVKDMEHIKDKVKVIFACILGALLMLVELYLMINSPANYIAIALFGVLILGDLYFLVTSLIEISYRREQKRSEQYDGIYKAEKASYMIFRKYFDSLAQTLAAMDHKLEVPAEEIISAQKAVAKVTINRSKENTDALMNSNDKLIEKLFEFQDMLSENNERLIERTTEVNSQSSRENEARLGELSSKMREMELSIKNEIYQTVNKMIVSGQQVVVSAPMPAAAPAPSAEPVQEMYAEPVQETYAEPEIDELPPFEELPVDELPIDELPTFDQLPIDEMPSMESEALSEPEMMAEPEPIAEPAAEELPPMPDLSDPNAKMSPDDIAALIANMNAGGGPAAAEPEPEVMPEPEPEVMPEPEPIAEPAAEELPPMPDLSDPNKMMTPDEIEALFANL